MSNPAQSALFHYPDRVRHALLQSPGLRYGDGSTASPEEIWEFLSVSGPRRFPAMFTVDRYHGGPSPDVDYLPGLKRLFWFGAIFDHIRKRQAQGEPIVAMQVGGPLEIFYAARCLTAHPTFPLSWLTAQEEGFDREAMQRRVSALRSQCRKSLPTECCTIVSSFRAVHEANCPVSFIGPVSMTSCSDAVFAMESARRMENNIPAFVVDFPPNECPGPWRVEYIAEQFRILAAKLGALSGVAVDEESLRAEIQRQGKLRRLARACTELWWQAEEPPTNSGDRFFMNVADQYNYPALMQILEEAQAELVRRIAGRQRGAGLSPDPLRLYVCGSCAHLSAYLVEQAGGVIVGHEQQLTHVFNDTDEEGDPFLNMARRACATSYELPPEQRGAWNAQIVRDSRADGVVMIYNWGCNYQSATAGAIAEIIREQSGVPVLVLDICQTAALNSAEQMRTRIEAFLEILARNRLRHWSARRGACRATPPKNATGSRNQEGSRSP